MTTEYRVSRAIAAPIDRVWALLADVGEQARWNSTLVSIEGEIRHGGEVTIVPKVNPGRTFKLRVSDVSAPNRMTWSDGMPLGLFKGVRTFELAETDGTTEFTMVETYSGPLAGLITRSIPDMTDSFAEYGDALKSAAETGG